MSEELISEELIAVRNMLVREKLRLGERRQFLAAEIDRLAYDQAMHIDDFVYLEQCMENELTYLAGRQSGVEYAIRTIDVALEGELNVNAS